MSHQEVISGDSDLNAGEVPFKRSQFLEWVPLGFCEAWPFKWQGDDRGYFKHHLLGKGLCTIRFYGKLRLQFGPESGKKNWLVITPQFDLGSALKGKSVKGLDATFKESRLGT